MATAILRDAPRPSSRRRRRKRTSQILRWMGLPFRLSLGLGVLVPVLFLSMFAEQVNFATAAAAITSWVWDG